MVRKRTLREIELSALKVTHLFSLYGCGTELFRAEVRFNKREDETRLSPLEYRHINVLGHYSFVLSEKIMQGKLRPFNQIADDIEDC
ncbi:MAG: hypothetical protein NTU48_00530 [Legionellales bacterium]|nr:hypothetical protein [Legionellales bacterium]